MGANEFPSQLIGYSMGIIGLSMLVKRPMVLEVMRELARRREITYIMGHIMVVAGLTLILISSETMIVADTLITIIGWVIFAESLLFLFASPELLKKYLLTLENHYTYYSIAMLYVVIGTWLVLP